MKRPKKTADARAGLRKKAEKKLSEQLERVKGLSSKGVQDLIHELGTHQIELEMQVEELQRAQAELEASRSKYSDLYDFAPIGYFTFDAGRLIREVNLTAAKLLGIERRYLVNKPFSAFVAMDDSSAFHAHCAAVVAGRTKQTTELRLKRRDKTEFFALLESIAVEGTEENTLAIRTAVSDITGRRKAEEALQKSELRYRSLNENMLEGHAFCKMLYDDRGRPADFVYLSVNKAFERLTGLKNVVHRKVTDVIPGIRESQPDLLEIYGRVAATGRTEKFEIEFKPLGMWLSISVYSTERGHFTAVFDNITERKNAAQTLGRSEEKYRLLFENMAEGFALYELLYDEQGKPVDWRVLEVNDAYLRHTGIPRDRILGRCMSELFPEAIAEYLPRFAAVVATQKAIEFETYATAVHRYQHVVSFPAGPRRFANTITDSTERMRMAEQTAHLASFPKLNPNPVLEIDLSGRVTFFNPAALTILKSLAMDEADAGIFLPADMVRILENWDGLTEANHYREIVLKDRVFGASVFLTPQFKTARIYAYDITGQKKAGEALRSSEEQARARAEELASVLDAVPAAVWIASDTQGLHITGNRLSSEWLRISEGANASKCAPDGERPETFRMLKNGVELPPAEMPVQLSAAGAEIHNYEFTLVYPDNAVRYVLGNATPLFDNAGKPRGSVSAFIDITERKQTEQALLQSREDMARAQEVGNIGSWRLDVRRNELVWSDENHRIFGIPKGTPLTYESFLAAVHPDDRAQVDTRWQAALRGEPYDLEHRIVVDGRVKWVREKAYLEFEKDDSLIGGFGITQDITERKHNEEALHKLNVELEHRVLERTRFYAVLAAINEAIVRKRDPQALFDEVCSIIVETGGFRLAWVGLVDRSSRAVRPVASSGETAYLDGLMVIAADVPEGRGPTGRAIVERRFVVNRDLETDATMVPWRKRAREHGIRSSSAFPLTQGGAVIGALTIYSGQPSFFTDEEMSLLQSLADDLGFALESIALDQKKQAAEEELRQSSADIRDLYNNAPCGYHSLDKDGTIVRINDTELAWLGYAREEVVGKKKISDFYLPEGVRKFREAYPLFVQGGSAVSLELDLVRGEGTVMQVLLNGTAVRDKDGTFIMSRSTMVDVTERKDVERRTALTNALLALFQKKYSRREYLDEACALIRSWSRFHNVGIRLAGRNKRAPFESCKGYDESFLQTENGLSVAEDQCICTRIIAGAMAPADRSAMTPQGSFFSANAAKFMENLAEDELKQYRAECMNFGFRSLAVIPIRYRDSTLGAIHLADEREGLISEKGVEFLEQLAHILGEAVFRFSVEEEQARLVLAVESSADAVAITDRNGYLRFVNPAFEQITGYRKEEVLNNTLHILDSGKQDEAFYRRVREAIARDGMWRGRLWSRKKDGTLYLEDCTSSPVRDAHGEVINYISVKRDVTESARLESIAESVNLMNNIGYVFSGVRHEIGNPINSAKMILSVLQLKIETSPKDVIKGYVDRTLVEIGRVEQLLKNLKNYNLYEKPELRNLDAAVLLQEFRSLVAHDFETKGIALSLEVPADAVQVCVDPRSLHQVLINLVMNAADAVSGRPQPSIRITASKKAGLAHIVVKDNGAGMTEKQQQDLFKPFYTSKHGGTGLGLVIVKKMLSRMNCGIAIASELEKGTIVDISIPEGTHEG
jgi:PAS domain S-box-containing protein